MKMNLTEKPFKAGIETFLDRKDTPYLVWWTNRGKITVEIPGTKNVVVNRRGDRPFVQNQYWR